jgi:hypothetical protein
MAEEAWKCLSTLLENVPKWIADLEDTLQTATERQKELLFENQPAVEESEEAEPETAEPRKASKSSSVRSHRSGNIAPDEPTKSEAEGAAPDGVQLTASDALRLAQRKRKTESVCSTRESGPYKYRSRHMVVVYYDGETQKRFEETVRAISVSRNHLRRGQRSARDEILARLYPPKDENESDDGLEMPRMKFRTARTMQRPTRNANETLVYDKIDSFLDKAQSMCERAAHQVLRDGDCSLEIKHAKQHFGEAQVLAQGEVPRWKQRAEEAVEKKRLAEEEEQKKTKLKEEAEAEAKANETAAADENVRLVPANSSEEHLVAPNARYSSSTAVDLEADDSEAENLPEFDINLLKSYTKRAYVKNDELIAR